MLKLELCSISKIWFQISFTKYFGIFKIFEDMLHLPQKNTRDKIMVSAIKITDVQPKWNVSVHKWQILWRWCIFASVEQNLVTLLIPFYTKSCKTFSFCKWNQQLKWQNNQMAQCKNNAKTNSKIECIGNWNINLST